MRIVHFAESSLPYISGITIALNHLVKEQKKQGHEVLIFAPHYPKAQEEENIIRLLSIASHYPNHRIPLPFGIRKDLDKFHPEVIHVHAPFVTGIAALYHAKRLKIPVVYTFHTQFDKYLHHVPLVPSFLLKKPLQKYLSWFCNRVSRIIAPTATMQKYLKKLKVHTPIEVIPNGLNFPKINEDKFALRKKLGLPQDKKLLIYLGRLSKEKNLLFLLKAFCLILKTDPNIHLVLVAHGPQKKELEKLSRSLDIYNNVMFVGEKSNLEAYAYLKACDLFVFTSKTETQGLVIAEAASQGLPSVALDADGVCEGIINNESGFLVNQDEKEFKEKVGLLLKNQELYQRFSETAKSLSKKKFAIQETTKEILSLYLTC